MSSEKMNIREIIKHGEFFAMMGTVIGLFLFAHHENVHITNRLDGHMTEIHKRIDAANMRSDDLHREFYELLKEMRKP